jgi:hypothetical protein
MINSISGRGDNVWISPAQTNTPVAMSVSVNECATHISSRTHPELSTLSRQLAESALRAEVRDQSMARRELGIEASRLLDQIAGDDYQALKQSHDAQRPDTDDSELLARAEQATDFITRADRGDRSVKSPFAALSREQLNLILYDETGPYTINERRAAWYGVFKIEQNWNQQVMRLYDMEAAANISNRPQTNTEIIAHYRTLPAIEQAQYPDNYESRLQAEIDYKGAPAKKDIKIYTLFEVLARMKLSGRAAKDSDANPSGWAPTNPTSNTASAITTSN